MDCNMTLGLIWRAFLDGDHETALELCDALRQWIDKGGFEPDWDAAPLSTSYYHGWINGREGY